MSALKVTAHAVILFVAIGVVACKSSPATDSSSVAAANSSASSSSPSPQSQSGSASTTQRGVLPKGFQSYNDPQGSGRVVFAKFTGGARSASGAMREFLGYMNGYFDAPPQFLGAVNDAQDRVVQAVWRGSLGGQPVRGAATVVIGKTDAVFAMLFDRPQSFAASYKRLAQALGPQMPRSANGNGQVSMMPDQNWQRQTAGDGSAAAFVPQGWRVTGCANGALDIVGPNKQSIELGLAYPIFSTPMPGSKPGSVVPYLNPVQAIMLFESGLDYNKLRSTPTSAFGRLIETTPTAWTGGQAIYALQEVNNPAMGGHRKALILMGTSQVGGNEWLLYTSFVGGEASTFDEDLPIMLKIWGSWKVNDSVYQERMKQALASMKETSAIITSMHDYQQKVYDNTNYAMDMVIRGNWPVENTETGARIEVNQNMATELEKQCQAQGIPCRQVPINQLTGH